jgi:DNA-binding MarR family transcriptional regulator
LGTASTVQATATVRLNLAVANLLGLPLTDVQCIGLLADGPATPTVLATRLGLTTGATTKVLDRLERGGYARRAADPADRRRVTVTATAEGLAKLAVPYTPIGEAFARVFDDYTDEELSTVLKFMRDSSAVADTQIDRIRRAGVPHATRSS